MNRNYFFDTSSNDRFSNRNKPSEQTYRALIDSIVFKDEDKHLLIPTGSTVGQVLQRTGVDSLGNPIYGWLSLNDYIKENDFRLLPEWRNKDNGYIITVDEDNLGNKILKWIPLPVQDLSVFYTKTESDARFVQQTSLYEIVGQSNNKIPVIDNNTNTIPEELVPMKAPERFISNWNAATNTPLLTVVPIFSGLTIIGYQAQINGQPLQRGDYLIATTSGTSLSMTFQENDRVITDGSAFYRVPSFYQEVVRRINGQTGVINLDFLRDINGDLTKATIDGHIASTTVHLTNLLQIITGRKVFRQGIGTDNIYSDTGGTITLNDHIAFSGNSLTRVNEFLTSLVFTSSTYTYTALTNTTVPLTKSIVEFVERRKHHITPITFDNKEVPSAEVASATFKNSFQFTNITGLTLNIENNLNFTPINVGGLLYAKFDISNGYTAEEVEYIRQHLTKCNVISGTDKIMPVILDYERNSEDDVNFSLKTGQFYFGNVITTGATYVAVNLMFYNFPTASYISVPYRPNANNVVADLFIKSIWYDFASLHDDNVYVKNNLTVRDNISARDVFSENVEANRGEFDYVISGVEVHKYDDNIQTLTNAINLQSNILTTVNPQLSNTFIKLPNMDNIKIGHCVKVFNTSLTQNMTLSVDEPLRDKIIGRTKTNILVNGTSITLNTGDFYELYAVEIDSVNGIYVWALK